MNWIDIVLVLSLAGVSALGAHRRLAGAVVAIAAILLWWPLTGLTHWNAPLGLLVSLLALAGLAVLARLIGQNDRLPSSVSSTLGGIASFALGCLLLLSIATSFPLQPALAENQFHYPPRNLSSPLNAVTTSELFRLGNDILFTRPELHGLFFRDRPWLP